MAGQNNVALTKIGQGTLYHIILTSSTRYPPLAIGADLHLCSNMIGDDGIAVGHR